MLDLHRISVRAVFVAGALCAVMTGCSDGSTNDVGTGGVGGSAGVGGAGGAGAEGGVGGTGGAPLEPGLYLMDCSVAIDSSNRIPFPVEFTLHASVDPALTTGGTSTLTTSAMVRVAPSFGIAPLSEAVVSAMELVLTVQGAEPSEIVHGLVAETSVYAPFLETDTQMTEVTHQSPAETVSVEISQLSVTVTGIPEELVPGGEMVFPTEESQCGDIHLQDGSSLIAFPVES